MSKQKSLVLKNINEVGFLLMCGLEKSQNIHQILFSISESCIYTIKSLY